MWAMVAIIGNDKEEHFVMAYVVNGFLLWYLQPHDESNMSICL